MLKTVVAILMVFAVTLAAVVGHRMSGEAVAVVVGVVCGVAASIPMSALILLLVNHAGQASRATHSLREQGSGQLGGYPPVVVIQGGTPVASDPATPYYTGRALPHPAEERSFRVIGQGGD
jgi:hypothetical protein